MEKRYERDEEQKSPQAREKEQVDHEKEEDGVFCR